MAASRARAGGLQRIFNAGGGGFELKTWPRSCHMIFAWRNLSCSRDVEAREGRTLGKESSGAG